MPGKKPLLHRFHAWRYKHISKTTFIYFLSVITGLLAGLGAVLIKNFTHVIQNLLEGKLVENYRYGFYFLFPIVGLALTVLIVKFVIRNPLSHGVPMTLRAIAKRKGLLRNYQVYASLITAPPEGIAATSSRAAPRSRPSRRARSIATTTCSRTHRTRWRW